MLMYSYIYVLGDSNFKEEGVNEKRNGIRSISVGEKRKGRGEMVRLCAYV